MNPLSPDSAESESLQMVAASIRGQIGSRACTCDVCNRRAYACVYRGCQKGVDLARIRPAEDRCHARDLSTLVDLVSHGCEEVGICRKQRVKVGHHDVLPDKGTGPVEDVVQGASHHLAPVVDAGSYGGKSPGRVPRFVSAPFCQSAAYSVAPSGLPIIPTIWPWLLMPWPIAPPPMSGSGKAVPFSHNTA